MAEKLFIDVRPEPGIATVMARKGVDAEAIGAALGLALPSGNASTIAGPITAIGTGPGTWLVIADGAAPDFAEKIAERVAGIASVSDQSSAYRIFRLTGAPTRRLLQRGLSIDLHPAAFAPGSVAVSVIAHIGVILWQVDDRPTYDVAVFRSFAVSFRHWLDQVGAAV